MHWTPRNIRRQNQEQYSVIPLSIERFLWGVDEIHNQRKSMNIDRLVVLEDSLQFCVGRSIRVGGVHREVVRSIIDRTSLAVHTHIPSRIDRDRRGVGSEEPRVGVHYQVVVAIAKTTTQVIVVDVMIEHLLRCFTKEWTGRRWSY